MPRDDSVARFNTPPHTTRTMAGALGGSERERERARLFEWCGGRCKWLRDGWMKKRRGISPSSRGYVFARRECVWRRFVLVLRSSRSFEGGGEGGSFLLS